ncbi:hypothetical protein CC80DRAFT_243480 [Byssothecium circinans]|uniref:Uncharacterized protein n=1 Tax=Byssothecium circinans TaxID=147558 RepID=A0A6A5TCG8_9PLEO|nr:hypothetical protein CC80DRAFT_243480 [Byssothecium circinans]
MVHPSFRHGKHRMPTTRSSSRLMVKHSKSQAPHDWRGRIRLCLPRYSDTTRLAPWHQSYPLSRHTVCSTPPVKFRRLRLACLVFLSTAGMMETASWRPCASLVFLNPTSQFAVMGRFNCT